MFRFLKYLINIFLLVFLASFAYMILFEPISLIIYMERAFHYFQYRNVQFITLIMITSYFSIIILSYLEIIFKAKKSISVKSENGNINVTYSTIESVSKSFLESKNIIKSAKTKVVSKCFGTELKLIIENYKTSNLNEKLNKIKLELEDHLDEILGYKPKRINLSISKINEEHVIEEQTIINEKIENDNIEEIVNID